MQVISAQSDHQMRALWHFPQNAGAHILVVLILTHAKASGHRCLLPHLLWFKTYVSLTHLLFIYLSISRGSCHMLQVSSTKFTGGAMAMQSPTHATFSGSTAVSNSITGEACLWKQLHPFRLTTAQRYCHKTYIIFAPSSSVASTGLRLQLCKICLHLPKQM